MHSLSKNPRKFSVIKKRSIFQTIIFFPQVVFSGASVWSWEHINRPNRGHLPVEFLTVLRASPNNTVQPDQSNCLSLNRQPPSSRPDILSACLFYLFNIQNKLNLLVSLIFLATTCLYITYWTLITNSGTKLKAGKNIQQMGFITRFLNGASQEIKPKSSKSTNSGIELKAEKISQFMGFITRFLNCWQAQTGKKLPKK